MSHRVQLRRSRRHVAATLAVLAAASALSACKEVKQAEKEHYSPAAIAPIKGGEEGEVSVTLTQEGHDRIDLATQKVTKRAGRLATPYASIVYENDGSAYVYANPKPLFYERAHIEIDRVAGDQVLLKEGPAVGTNVVTVGVAQLHGAEKEYGEY